MKIGMINKNSIIENLLLELYKIKRSPLYESVRDDESSVKSCSNHDGSKIQNTISSIINRYDVLLTDMTYCLQI